MEYSKVFLQFLFRINSPSLKFIRRAFTLNRATKCHPFRRSVFVKPEVFLIGVSQTESPTSTPKVVALDSSYDGRLRRKRSLIKDEVDKSL